MNEQIVDFFSQRFNIYIVFVSFQTCIRLSEYPLRRIIEDWTQALEEN